MSPQHYYEENHYYFITTVTQNRKPLFNDKLACELFINLLTYHKFSSSYNIKAFVIMPDHVHFIIQPMGKYNISEIMKKIKGSFSRYYNQLNKSTGTVLQKGFYDTVIRSEKQLREIMDYIHHNPMQKGIVSEVQDYYYSSYSYYFDSDDRFGLVLRESFE